MESLKTRKTAVLVIVVVLLVSAAAAALWFLRLSKAPEPALSQFARSDLPTLDLRLQFITTKGEEVPGAETRLAAGAPGAEIAPACPELTGGDIDDPTPRTEAEKRGEACGKSATWTVKQHPIGLSLYFRDGDKVLAMFDNQTMVRELLQNRLFQGLFYEPLRDAGIRAEDLRLNGLEGAFLKTVIREAVAADGVLHYDIAHGKKGFVFSFVRSKCIYFTKALPLLTRVLVRSGYRIPALQEPILEMRIGLQRLFMTQVNDRVYLANGLEGLINVLESLPIAAQPLPDTPLVLTVRSEAFVAGVLPVMVGAPEWELRLGFGVSPKDAGEMQFSAGKLTRALSPKVYKGIAASIPHDVFASLITSYSLSPSMSTEEWRRLVMDGPGEKTADLPDEAGLAIIWDLDAGTSGITQMGVVIASQKTPQAAPEFAKYFRDKRLTAECGGGTVFLAATSEKLLVRMKESCNGQSLSVLDWEKGEPAKAMASSQLMLFLNAGSGLRELFLAGGAAEGQDAGEFAPQWKKEYEEAKAAMRRDGEKVFASLPIFAYHGNGSATAQTVELQGLTVKQGGAK